MGLPPLTWTTAFTQWEFAPPVTASVAVVGALYAWGVFRAVRGRGRAWPWWRVASFGLGLLIIALSLQSSIGVYDDDLFWIHMVQHLLLIMVAPPLLVIGAPVMLLLHTGSPPVHRATRRLVRSTPVTFLTNPAVAVIAYTIVVLVTHLTGFMDTVLSNQVAHDGEHALYLLAGYLYFLPIFGDEPIRWRLSYPMKILLLLLSMPVDTFTGVALMQSRGMYGMSAGDIHDGGAVMWIGGDFIMLVAILVVFVLWARSEDRQGATGRGWLEEARRAVFRERTAAMADRLDLDNDDEQLAAYNAWLRRLNEEEPQDARDPVRRRGPHGGAQRLRGDA